MTEPEGRKTGEGVKPPVPADLSPGEEAAVRAEDAYDDAQSAHEARAEAEELDAIPWERLRKDEEH